MCLGLAVQADAQAITDLTLQVSPLVQSSSWKERGVQGNELLRERGVLFGCGGLGNLRLGTTHVTLSGQFLSGRRHYIGQDSLGAAAQTDVRVALSRYSAAWSHVWPNGMLLGLEGVRRVQRRELLDIPSGPYGYTEQWRTHELHVRLGMEEVTEAGVWSATMAWAPWARTQLQLIQQNRDDAQLSPQRQQVAQLQANWQTRSEAVWRLGVSGQVEWRRSLRSDPVGVTRYGLIKGVATQPETRELWMGLGVHLSHIW